MQFKYKFPFLYESIILIVSVLLALFTYLQPGSLLIPGLDPSWGYGLNYTFQNHLIMGKDIYFTFGPLGFLEHTAPLTLSILDISSNFWFVCSIISYFLIFKLCKASALDNWRLLVNIVLAFVLIIYASDHIQRLLIIAYVCAFLHWRTQKIIYLWVILATAIICLMIKFSYGATVLALYFPYLIAISLRDKQPVNALIGIVLLPILYCLGWYYLYHSLTGSIGYLKGGLEFSQGSISAMASDQNNNWPAIGAFYVAFIYGTLIVGRSYKQGWIVMPLCFLGPLFIWSKYAFGREDSGHLAYLMSFVFYIGILWMIAVERLLHKITCLLVIVICFFSWKQISLTAWGSIEFQPRPTFFSPSTFKYRWSREEVMEIMNRESDAALSTLQLDSEILEKIGTHSVDVYPWETLITKANNLNWTPRPIYQSYITYTPFLDRKNQEFYESAKAPEFIIWHYHSYQDIDNRYSFSSDPLTLQAILQHYRMDQCKGGFCLWRHMQQDQLQVTPLPSTKDASWNNWIDLPTSSPADVIRAHLNVHRSLLGKLNIALWKEGGIEIDYRLKNGDIKTHTLLIDNASSGLWASPYMTDQISEKNPEPISQQQLKTLMTARQAEAYIEKAESVVGGLHIVGWGFLPFQASQTQESSLLLYNDQQAYSLKIQNRARGGITNAFKQTGIVDLDTCGIDELINSRTMIPGQYRVGIAIKNAGESAVHIQNPPVMLDVEARNPENAHNVEAIRIRTSRPWAFTDTITISWSELTFTVNPFW